jgi:hypothetical protein
MSIQVGDKVRFLNDVGGGTVSRLIDRKSVMVMNDYGFEVPTQIQELVVIEQAISYDGNKSTSSNTAPSGSKEPEKERIVDTSEIFYPQVDYIKETGDAINIFFAFVPKGRPGNSDLDMYLINDSNYNVLYSIISKDGTGVTASNSVGVLEANTKELIEAMALASVNTLPEYIFHLIFYRKGEFPVKDPIIKQLSINPIKFYKEKTYLPNDFFNHDSLLFPVYAESPLAEAVNELTHKEIKEIISTKEKVETNPVFTSRKEKEGPVLEVDLHIHELLDDFRGLTNGEILEVQIAAFKSKLDEASRLNIKKAVFIHGVGNGVLKLEIRKELDKLSKKLSYQDASFKEYGYGATLVQLK